MLTDPPDSRLSDRLLAEGANSLSTAELLALVLGTGDDDASLARCRQVLTVENGVSRLLSMSATDMGEALALEAMQTAHLLAALELGRRLSRLDESERPLVRGAADAARLMQDMVGLTQEHVRVILLDNSQHVIAIETVYIGTFNTSVLRVAEIFREAVARSAAALVLVHNHPAGNPTPSPEDVDVTRAVNAAARLLDLILLDHVIIGRGGYASLRELGLGF